MPESIPFETERKFLIEYPDITMLKERDGCRVIEIEQTYLLCSTGSLRVRKTVSDGETRYFRNEKRRVSEMTHLEDEKLISHETYSELLRCRDGERKTVVKTRYAFPYVGHTVEVDVYPFWNDRAILEIELENENEGFEIPDIIKVIKEVTTDGRYSNKALSKEVVTEDIK